MRKPSAENQLRSLLNQPAAHRRLDPEQRAPRKPQLPKPPRPQFGGLPFSAFANPGRDVDPFLFGFEEAKQGERIRMTTRYNGHFVGSQVVASRKELEAQRTMWLRGDYDELVRGPSE